MAAELVTIYWRDIPAQITAQEGRTREKALLGARFQHAIDRAAMVAGMAKATQYVLPYTIADGNPARMRVINKIGMERAGYADQAIAEVRRAFRTLFMRELRLEDAVREVEQSLGDHPHIRLLLDAITSSKRGIARPESSTFEINVSG